MPTQTKLGPLLGPQGNPYMTTLQNTIPGLPGLTSSASNIIRSELGGMPDPTETRTANAAWGAGAGLPPGTPFLEGRGQRLYRSEIENRQRQGIDDLLKFLRGYSGTVSPSADNALNYTYRSNKDRFNEMLDLRDQQLRERAAQQPKLEEYRSTVPGPFGYDNRMFFNPNTGTWSDSKWGF